MVTPKITVSELKALSYTDFVGYINQWNVLPGSYSTLSKWQNYSHLNQNSRLLEVACTTGFSSRELAKTSGCQGVGIDISKKSIEAAKNNLQEYAPEVKIDYFHQDAYTFRPTQKFSHIAVGASLKFFPDPKKMFDLCVSWLNDGGFLLASPFYVNKKIPTSLVSEFEKIFNISPTQVPYKEIMALYQPLEIIFEERNDLIPETEDELKYYCNSTISRICQTQNIEDPNIKEVIYQRLYDIKRMSNLLRPYQGYTVLVLRYEKNVYPNRFVELF
jgi:SAM-dependent methyltransferase